MNNYIGLIITILSLCCSCQSATTQTNNNQEAAPAERPAFSADSAYLYIQQQVALGPRTPKSAAHRQCGDMLVAKLQQYGATVMEQNATVTAYNQQQYPLRNIIASFSTDKKERIMLCAHWDTRPWADMETDPQEQQQPIDGANDGASGVAVLLEIARQLQLRPASIGVDIILFDMEDMGAPRFWSGQTQGETFCLGSQYWGKNSHQPNYQAQFGILLDMVGGTHATFHKEQISLQYAPQIVDKVWSAGQKLGYSNIFINQVGGAITDDHLFVNQLAGIPCIDIINYDANSLSGFGNTWHTLDDNIHHISKSTLQAVGETVLETIYQQ